MVTSNKTDTPFGSVPITDEYKVVGIFDVGMYDYDRGVIFIPRTEGASLVRSDNDISKLEIFLIDGAFFKASINAVSKLVGDNGKVFTWKSIHKELFSALEIEKKVMFLILFLIIFVAAFNLISSIIMIVKDKERGIGILRSLGVKSREIQRIFILIGSVIGMFGTIIGTTLGIIVSLNIGEIQIFLEELFGSKLLPQKFIFSM